MTLYPRWYTWFHKDFDLYELVHTVLNTAPNNITLARMFKNISSSSNLNIFTQKVLLKEIMIRNSTWTNIEIKVSSHL